VTNGRAARGRFGPTAALLVGLVALYFLRYVLLPFVAAAAIAYVVNPAVVWLERSLAVRRGLAGIVVFVLVVATGAAVAIWIGLPVWHDIRDIVVNLPTSLHRALAQLLHNGSIQVFGERLDADQLTAATLSALRSFFGAPGNALAVATIALAAVIGATLTVVLLFYFLVAGDRLLRGMVEMVPIRHRPLFRDILRRLDPVLGRYLRGVAAVAAYAIAVASVGLTFLLDVPHPLFFAVTSGLLELLPVLGPIAAALIVGAAVVQHASLRLVFVFFAYLTVLRLSIDQVVGPLVLGRVATLHPTVVIFALLAGGSIFGPLGLLLAIPAAVTVKVTREAMLAPAPGAADLVTHRETAGRSRHS
jgi:predicted PurR-regulated permease PerM